jgi:hypothetical protein
LYPICDALIATGVGFDVSLLLLNPTQTRVCRSTLHEPVAPACPLLPVPLTDVADATNGRGRGDGVGGDGLVKGKDQRAIAGQQDKDGDRDARWMETESGQSQAHQGARRGEERNGGMGVGGRSHGSEEGGSLMSTVVKNPLRQVW